MRNNFLVRALTRANAQTRTSQSARSLCSSPSSADVALKNVTKSNFEAVLAELRRHVREADFVSIDLEMTGITSAPWRETFEFDRPDIQYLKVKDSAHKFAVVQFGVCPFRWDPHTTSFVANPHNFYIFPRQEITGDGASYDFLCQTSSLKFLAEYQFDFNTCFNEGISYLSRSQEEEALKRLDSVYKDEFPDFSNLRNGSDMQLVRTADILFAERMKNVVGEWRAGLLRGGNWGSESQGTWNDMNQKFQTTFFQTRPALEVNGLTSRQLKLIKLVTEIHFKDLAYVHVTGENSRRQPLIVYTDSTKDRDLLKREVKACQKKASEMNIKAAIGFRHVIDLLSSERKLIVGHNCFLDIAHVYSKFIGPLPSTAEEFASAVRTYFPSIIDTKVLLNSDYELLRIMKKGSTSLSKAFGLLCLLPVSLTGSSTGVADKLRMKVEVQVDDQRFSNWNSGAKHEAGYDAFMTGCVFSHACSHLGIDFNSHAPSVDLLHNEKLQKYINHLYLSWVKGDTIDLKTGKSSSAGSLGSTTGKRWHTKFAFSNMILLWRLPAKLKAKDIRDCISKAFGSGSVTSVHHLDETAAFVQFSKPELVSGFLELKDSLERDNNPISVLHPLSTILETGRVRAATYEAYNDVCSSPLSEVLFSDQAEKIGVNGKAGFVKPAMDVDEEEDIYKKEGERNGFRICDQAMDSLYASVAQLSR